MSRWFSKKLKKEKWGKNHVELKRTNRNLIDDEVIKTGGERCDQETNESKRKKVNSPRENSKKGVGVPTRTTKGNH